MSKPKAEPKPPTLEPIDRRIIGLLETDGRMTNRAIAQALEVGEVEVARRLRLMKSNGSMTTSVFTSLASFGYRMRALVRLAIDVRRRAEAERELVQIESFFMLLVSRTFDRYDYIGSIAVRDLGDLEALLEERLGRVPGFEGIELHLALEPLRLASSIGIIVDDAAHHPDLPLRAEWSEGQMDELDVAIIRELMDDSRRPLLTIAGALKVSEATIRRRVAQMTEAGAIRFGPVVNPNAFGVPWLTIAWIDVEPTRMWQVADRLRRLPVVGGLYSIAGPLGNLYASLHGDHPRTVPDAIEREIAPLPGIRRITTHEALRLLKYSGHWREMRPGGEHEQPPPGWPATAPKRRPT